jgi:hypothetical protein
MGFTKVSAQNYNGGMIHTNTNGWSTASTSYVTPANATGIALNTKVNNLGTIAPAAGSVPGITFTPNRIGNFQIVATIEAYGSTNGVGAYMQMIDGSSNVLCDPKGTAPNSNPSTVVLTGQINVTSLASSVSAIIQLRNALTAGTAFIASAILGSGVCIQWSITEII